MTTNLGELLKYPFGVLILICILLLCHTLRTKSKVTRWLFVIGCFFTAADYVYMQRPEQRGSATPSNVQVKGDGNQVVNGNNNTINTGSNWAK